MQINSKFSYVFSNKRLWWLKIIVFFIVAYCIYLLILQKGESIEDVLKSFRLLYSNNSLTLLFIVLLLTPVNWAFEAWKWQKLASKVEQISFWEAYRGVLVGLTFATATPLMIGDYAGKIFMLKTDKRSESIGAILLGNGIQLYVSLLFGTASYLFFILISHPAPFYLHVVLITILAISLLVGAFLGLNLQRLDSIKWENKLYNYIKKYLIVLKTYQLKELKDVFLIAVGRYLTFTIQFFLMLKIFQIDLPIPVMLGGVGMILLAKTLASVLNFLGDLSVRELTSVYYFSYFGIKISVITTATFSIWLINVLLPILIGSLLVLELKMSTKRT